MSDIRATPFGGTSDDRRLAMTPFKLVLPALLFAVGCSAHDDDPPTAATQSALTCAEHKNPNPALFDKDARPFGVSMERWSERWWGWAMGTPLASNPNLDPTADCDANQEGPMFFLPHLLTGASTIGRACNVPRHKPIAISVASVFNDFPCPDPTFNPAPGQSLFDFLIGPVKEGQDHVATIEATLDGQPLDDLLSYRVASGDLFHFTGDTSMQGFDNCITGSVQKAVADSFFIVLKPLARGTHEYTVKIVSITGTVFGPRTTTLNVVGDD
jgi:hypothetical protein